LPRLRSNAQCPQRPHHKALYPAQKKQYLTKYILRVKIWQFFKQLAELPA
jgi:hypothetical protein